MLVYKPAIEQGYTKGVEVVDIASKNLIDVESAALVAEVESKVGFQQGSNIGEAPVFQL